MGRSKSPPSRTKREKGGAPAFKETDRAANPEPLLARLDD